MRAFDAFIESKNDISAWIKWIHWSVPDDEGSEREKQRKRLAAERHCLKCTALSGCYFVTSCMPGNISDEMLHPHCDCTFSFIDASSVKKQIRAFCPPDKFQNYTYSEKGLQGGKTHLFEGLGFTIDDIPYLVSEYERQAQEKYSRGDYVLYKLKDYGQIINIYITISGNGKTRIYKSGWLVHPLGYIHCTTPFAGFGGKKNENI